MGFVLPWRSSSMCEGCPGRSPRALYPRPYPGDRPLNLTFAARQRIVTVQEQWAAMGRRVLVLARRVVARGSAWVAPQGY